MVGLSGPPPSIITGQILISGHASILFYLQVAILKTQWYVMIFITRGVSLLC